MPYEIKQSGSKHCVHKKGESTPIKGGCHSTRKDALQHMRALYANVAMSERISVLTPVAFFAEAPASPAEVGDLVEVPSNSFWVQAFRAGSFEHRTYGTIDLNEDRFRRFEDNFNNNVTLNDLVVDYEHGIDPSKGYQAAGWVRAVRAGSDRLDKLIEFTSDALTEIRAKKWRYYSSEFSDTWERNDGQLFEDVLHGGGLTNKPFLRGMAPLNLSEIMPDEWVRKAASEGFLPWEIEHGEPGSGVGEPTPRQDGEPDRAADNGWRRDTPPIVQEEENMTLRELAQSLGIAVTDEMDDAKLSELITEKFTTQATELTQLNEELEPLRKAREEANARQQFRDSFPTEYEQMQRLVERDRDASAREFSSTYERFVVDSKEQKHGFSALVLSEIEDAHKKLATRTASPDDLKNLLDKIANNGIVDYSEHGSQRARELSPTPAAGSKDARQQFMDLTMSIVEQDGLEFDKALSEAARRDPELAEAYQAAPVLGR